MHNFKPSRVRPTLKIPGAIALVRTPERITLLRMAQRWPVLIILILIVLEIRWPARVWLVLLAGVVTALGLSLWWAISVGRGSHVQRALLHTWVQVGDLLEEQFTLRNNSGVPLIAAEVEDRSDVPGYAQSAVRAAGVYSSTQWRQTGTSRKRGLYHLGPTRLHLTDPLGLFEITTEYPETREVLVFPPVLQDLNADLSSGGGQGTVTMRQRSLQATAAVGSVRGYVAGDPIRRIHWPLSSRHQTLMVKEFDREMGGNVWLALDLDQYVQLGAEEDSTLEDVIVWGASWAWHLLKAGKRVGVIAYGPKRVMLPPMGGNGHLWNILRALAPLEANTKTPLPILLDEATPRVTRGDALIVVTPSIDSHWPERLAKPGLNGAFKLAVLIEAALPPGAATVGQYAHDVEYQNSRIPAMHAMLRDLDVKAMIGSQAARREATPAARGSGNWDVVRTAGGTSYTRSRPTRVQA